MSASVQSRPSANAFAGVVIRLERDANAGRGGSAASLAKWPLRQKGSALTGSALQLNYRLQVVPTRTLLGYLVLLDARAAMSDLLHIEAGPGAFAIAGGSDG
jgi:hypothetical protein